MKELTNRQMGRISFTMKAVIAAAAAGESVVILCSTENEVEEWNRRLRGIMGCKNVTVKVPRPPKSRKVWVAFDECADPEFNKILNRISPFLIETNK